MHLHKRNTWHAESGGRTGESSLLWRAWPWVQSSKWGRPDGPQCGRCQLLEAQIRALAQSLAGVCGKIFNWSGALGIEPAQRGKPLASMPVHTPVVPGAAQCMGACHAEARGAWS